MSVGRICTRVVVTGSPQETVLVIAGRMESEDVGSVVIVDGSGEPIGIVTDRDLVLRCVARRLHAGDTPVSAIMTRGVRTVDEATPIEQAVTTMAAAGVRRLVVTGSGGRLAGILSLDDVAQLLVGESASIGSLLWKETPELVQRT